MMEARVVRDFLHTAGGVMVPIEHVYEQIRTFAADAGARKVVLFGSRAKGVVAPISIAWSRTFRTICGHCLKLMSLIWMSRFPSR